MSTSENQKDKSHGRKGALLRAASLVLLVFAVAVALFQGYQQTRHLELSNQYMRLATRAAAEVRLNLESSSQLLATLYGDSKGEARRRDYLDLNARQLQKKRETLRQKTEDKLQAIDERLEEARAQSLENETLSREAQKLLNTQLEAARSAYESYQEANRTFETVSRDYENAKGTVPAIEQQPQMPEPAAQVAGPQTQNDAAPEVPETELLAWKKDLAAKRVEDAVRLLRERFEKLQDAEELVAKKSENHLRARNHELTIATAKKSYEETSELDDQAAAEAFARARAMRNAPPEVTGPASAERAIRACENAPGNQHLCEVQALAKAADISIEFVACEEGMITDDRRPRLRVKPPSVMFPTRGVKVCAQLPLGGAPSDRNRQSLLPVGSVPVPQEGSSPEIGAADQAFLVDAVGRVLYSVNESNGVQMTRLRDASEEDEAEQKAASPLSVERVKVGERVFRTFVARVDVGFASLGPKPADCEDCGEVLADDSLHVAVLVDEQRLLRESRRFNPTYLMLLFFGLGLALLSIPAAKLWLMGPNDSFNAFDVTLFGFAGLFAVLIATVGLWSIHGRGVLSDSLNERLSAIVDEAHQDLSEELSLAKTALLSFAEETAELRPLLLEAQTYYSRHEVNLGTLLTPEQQRNRKQALQIDLSSKEPVHNPRRERTDETEEVYDDGTSEENAAPATESARKVYRTQKNFPRGAVRNDYWGCELAPWFGYRDVAGVCEGVRIFGAAEGATPSEVAAAQTRFERMTSTSDVPQSTLQYTDRLLFTWALPDGRQLAKFINRDHASLPFDMSGREYFKRASSCSLDPIPTRGVPLHSLNRHDEMPERCKPEAGAAAQVIRSRTTGRYELVLARPVVTPPHKEQSVGPDESPVSLSSAPHEVVTISTPLKSLQHRFLPSEMSVALIKQDGEVLFHSGDRWGPRSGHNLFEDLNDTETLRATLSARLHNEPVDVTYLGVRSRFVTVPIPETGWFLIAMSPLSGIDKMVATLGALTTGGYMSFALLLVILAALVGVVLLLIPRDRGRLRAHVTPLLRPQLGSRRGYVLAGASAIIISWFLSCLALLIPASRAWVLVAVAFVSLFLPWVLAHFGRRVLDRGEGRRVPIHGAYSVWVFGIACLWVFVPVNILFAGAYDLVVSNSIRSDQEFVVRGIEDACRGRGDAINAAVPTASRECSEFIDEVLEEIGTQDEPPQLLLGVGEAPAGSSDPPISPQTVFTGLVDLLLGPLASPTLAAGYLHRADLISAPERRLHFSRDSDSSIQERREGDTKAEVNRRAIPKLFSNPRRTKWMIAIVLLASLLSLGLVVTNVRRLFSTNVLTKIDELKIPTLQNLPLPPLRGSFQKLRVRLSSEAEREALLARKSRDFRLFHLESNSPDRPQGAVLIGDLGDFCKVPLRRRYLHRLLRQRRTLLMLVVGQIDGSAWGPDKDATIFERWKLRFQDFLLCQRLRRCDETHLEILDERAVQPILQTPRFVIHNPPPHLVRQYQADERVVTMSADLPQDFDKEKILLVPDLHALAGTPALRDDFRSRLERDPGLPVICMLVTPPNRLHLSEDSLIPDLMRETLYDFVELRSPIVHDPRLSRYQIPPRSYLSWVWKCASLKERSILIQVARGGFVPPHERHNRQVLSLVARSILDPDDLTLHPRLASFVREHADEHEKRLAEARSKEGESESSPSGWEVLKAPLSATVMAVLGVFGLSDPAIALPSLLAPSAFAGLPALFQLLLRGGGTPGD